MEKQKIYRRIKFVPKAIESANRVMEQLASGKKEKLRYTLRCGSGRDKWTFDSPAEFMNQYPTSDNADYSRSGDSYALHLYFDGEVGPGATMITVQAPSREEILTVFNVFEDFLSESTLPSPPEPPPKPDPKPRIFIGHGRSPQWRDLKDHLADKHGYEVEAYEVGSRAGHAIRDILEDMLIRSSIAFLVLTGEDQMADGTVHGRENVIHETGLFQGRLGFARAIILLEEGANEFSNIAGVQQIRFAKGHIKETFGEVLAVLRREFGESQRS